VCTEGDTGLEENYERWSDEATITLNVFQVNDIPTVENIEAQSFPEDNSLTVSLEATDPDNDLILSYTVSNESSDFISLSNDETDLTITPDDDFNGNFSVFTTFIEDGGEGYEATMSFDVTVTPVNDPPVVIELPTQNGTEDNSISIDLSATDVDGDSDFTFDADINNGETTNISNISLDFVSSEDTSNFDDGNITVNGGTIAGFSGSSSEYSAEFSSNSFGEKNIQVLENSFSDVSGNQNTTSNTFSWIYDAVAPVLNLNDPLIVEVEAGTTYEDPGYVVSDDFDISVDVQISGDSVDLTTLGDYNIIYTATDNAGNQTQKQRVVRVNDTTPPVITLVPETETVYLNVGDSYSLPNAFLSDNHDDSPILVQTPTLPNTAIEGTYELYWVAKDSNDNASSKYITVVVGSPPVVTITPPNPYQIPLGDCGKSK
jgi:hypothetical protein